MGLLNWLQNFPAFHSDREFGSNTNVRTDSDEMEEDIVEPEEYPEDIDGHLLLMEYIDAAGALSLRTIQLLSTRRSREGHMLLSAHCFLRRTMRTFRSDRIVSLANARTGEVIENPSLWLNMYTQVSTWAEPKFINNGAEEPATWKQSHVRESNGNSAREFLADLRKRSRPIFVLLMATARADIHVPQSEIDVLTATTAAESARFNLVINKDGMADFARSMAAIDPTRRMIKLALNRLRDDVLGRIALAEYLEHMVRADNKIHVREVENLREMVQYIGGSSISSG